MIAWAAWVRGGGRGVEFFLQASGASGNAEGKERKERLWCYVLTRIGLFSNFLLSIAKQEQLEPSRLVIFRCRICFTFARRIQGIHRSRDCWVLRETHHVGVLGYDRIAKLGASTSRVEVCRTRHSGTRQHKINDNNNTNNKNNNEKGFLKFSEMRWMGWLMRWERMNWLVSVMGYGIYNKKKITRLKNKSS